LVGSRAAIDAYLAAGNLSLTAPSVITSTAAQALTLTVSNAEKGTSSRSELALQAGVLQSTSGALDLPDVLPVIANVASALQFAGARFGQADELINVTVAIAADPVAASALGVLAAGQASTSGVVVSQPASGEPRTFLRFSGTAAAIGAHLAKANALTYTGSAGALLAVTVQPQQSGAGHSFRRLGKLIRFAR
jgi:hypothetical protein